MEPKPKILRRQTISGPPIIVGDKTITPQSQAITVQLPFGGWVWNRPVAVEVTQAGYTHRLPIVDLTRLAQCLLWGLSLSFLIITLSTNLQKETDHE